MLKNRHSRSWGGAAFTAACPTPGCACTQGVHYLSSCLQNLPKGAPHLARTQASTCLPLLASPPAPPDTQESDL